VLFAAAVVVIAADVAGVEGSSADFDEPHAAATNVNAQNAASADFGRFRIVAERCTGLPLAVTYR
jgi:hypothetical protein